MNKNQGGDVKIFWMNPIFVIHSKIFCKVGTYTVVRTRITFFANPDPTFDFEADPDPTFLFDADPDPGARKLTKINK